MRRLRPSLGALGLALLLAGCSGAAPSTDVAGGVGPDGIPLAGNVTLNYTTPDRGGAPYVRDYSGVLTPEQAANGGVPLGASVPDHFETCCYVSMLDAPDLLNDGQLVAMELTLTWTNTQTDHAGLDAAVCIPWHCIDFNRGEDESLADGEHQDVLTRVTSGRQEFLDGGFAYQVGVRFTNAVLSSGLAYEVHVELTPVGNGLAFGEAYELEVAPNATLSAQLVGPLAGRDPYIGLMVYDREDRPYTWVELRGKHLETFGIPLAPGRYVVAVLDFDAGFVRLVTDRAPSTLALRPLETEAGQVDLVGVPDAQAHEGSLTYVAEPGIMGDFPWFLYGDGVAAQDAMGFQPTPMGGANLTFASSSGLVAAIGLTQLSYQAAGTQNCFNCNGQGTWHPANYVDDDGEYQIEWRSQGGAGTFVMFTQRYVR